MVELCLFDLDGTLVETDDLEKFRLGLKNNNDKDQLAALRCHLKCFRRTVYCSAGLLTAILRSHRNVRLGVFTRSPRSYAKAVLEWAYPDLEWDVIVAYEDVELTKPSGEGILHAMEQLEVEDIKHVLMVGDDDKDIRASYNAGCRIVLLKASWQALKNSSQWRALNLVPDAILDHATSLLEYLEDPNSFLPELERRMAGGNVVANGFRIDELNHFNPHEEMPRTPQKIYTLGRYFSKKNSLEIRRNWHALSQSIEDEKESSDFPKSWEFAVKLFVARHARTGLFGPREVLLTAVPHRPGRHPRLEYFLDQLAQSYVKNPPKKYLVRVVPGLLSYKEGVKSHHKERLKEIPRFDNVRDNLFVNKGAARIDRRIIFLLDDVCTTGASLLYAKKYLIEAGACQVFCLALAKNIGEVL